MARKALTDAIIKLYQKLGGNVSDVLGTRTNVSFIGKGEPDILKMDLNPEALGILPQSKAVDELKDSVQYAAGDKLNDIQASKLLENMSKMDEFYNPLPGPANITDFKSGVRNLDREGLMSLRRDNVPFPEVEDYMPPKGSRGGPDDIAAPFNVSVVDDPVRRSKADLDRARVRREMKEKYGFTDEKIDEIENINLREEFDLPDDIDAAETILPTSAGLESLKTVKNNDVVAKAIADKVYEIAGVAENAKPVARGNARDFLNRIKDVEDPTNPGGPTLSSIMEVDDFKFMTEGGGGALGDPLLLVQKYFGPRVSSAVAKLDGPDEIQGFVDKLVNVKDARGRTITDRGFDPESVDPEVFEFADGGLASLREGYRGGKLVGKALGLFKKQQAIEKGVGEGFAAAEQYGITGPMVSKLFREIAMDRTLVGKEKTEYFKVLNEALKNPDKYPDEILQIQKKLGIDIGLKSGGLAKILEV